MAKTDNPSNPSNLTYADDPASRESDVTAAFLKVLNSVNAQSKTALQLQGKAKFAVEHFQAISRDLSTLADGPPSASASPK